MPDRRTIIIGVGNPTRRDDGVGTAFVRDLRERLGDASDVRLVESDGDPGELLESWTGADVAIVVDVSSSGAAPGTVTEIDASRGSNGFGLRHSTHGMGVIGAVALGKALGRMPSRLLIYGIEGQDFGYGMGLTPAVEEAMTGLAERVADEVSKEG